MKPLSLATVAEYAGGRLVSGNPERQVTGLSTDSRAVRPGDLFVALKGERFDGHRYVSNVQSLGAIAAVVEQGRGGVTENGFGLVEVEDTLSGLQSLSGRYRESLPAKVVALTGSSGKSSTKEMIASVLAQKFQVHRTEKNFNNHIGLPLTLLGATEDTEIIVAEIGMNHPGEISPLAGLARPDMAVVANVGWAHIEFFESIGQIAEEKRSILKALREGGVAIFNADDPLVRATTLPGGVRGVMAGRHEDAAYRYDQVEVGEGVVEFDLIADGKTVRASIPTAGPHMVRNAILAAAVGGEFGLSLEEIAEGLRRTPLAENRYGAMRFEQGWLVDDTYNANPDSVMAGVDSLGMLSGEGRMVLLFGAMGELGSRSEELHRWVGREAVARGVKVVFALGEDAVNTIDAAREAGLSGDACRWFETHEELAGAYLQLRDASDRVLIKGSRARRMERVMERIRERKVQA